MVSHPNGGQAAETRAWGPGSSPPAAPKGAWGQPAPAAPMPQQEAASSPSAQPATLADRLQANLDAARVKASGQLQAGPSPQHGKGKKGKPIVLLTSSQRRY